MNFILILLIKKHIYIYIYIYKEQIEKVFNMTYNTNFAHTIHAERIFNCKEIRFPIILGIIRGEELI